MRIVIWNIIYLGLILLTTISCSKNNNEHKEVNLDFFHTIKVDDSFNLYLEEDTCFYLELHANKDVLKNISYTINDSILTLDNSTGFKWLSPTENKIELIIHSLPLKEVYLNETCHLQTINPISSVSFGLIISAKSNEATLDLNCKTFYYWNNFPSGGRLTLLGKAEQIKLWNDAIFSVDASQLIAQKALVENNSKGNCIVNVSDYLEYSITNMGNIYVANEPREIVEIELSSSGRLIKQ